MEQASIVGVAVDYAGLRGLIAARRRELGLRQLEVDDLAGVQSGYTGKLECGLRHFGDMSMGAVLGALGLSLVAVRSAPLHNHQRLEEARASYDRLREMIKKRGAKGGRARVRNLTPLQLSKSASRMARSRWKKYRASRSPKAKRTAVAIKNSPAVQAGL